MLKKIKLLFRQMLFREVNYKHSLELNPIDLKNLADQFQPRQRGEDDGNKGIPVENQVNDFSFYMEIAVHVQNYLYVKYKGLISYFGVLGNSISRINLKSFNNNYTELENEIKKQEGKFKTELCNLSQIKENYTFILTDLNTFKIKHGIPEKQQADYPISHIYYLGIVGILILLEAAMNAVFFSITHLGGVFGALMQAFIIAFVNVLPAYFMGGKVLPYFNHRRYLFKLFATMITGLFLAWIVLFNLSVSLYRDQLDMLEDMKVAQQSVMAKITSMDLFSLHAIDSWILFGVGMVFAIIALVDGYKSDDPYPSFGRRARKLKCKTEHYSNFIRRLKKFYDEYCDQIRDEIEGIENDFNRKSIDIIQNIARFSRNERLYNACVSASINVGKTCCSIYIEENMAKRENFSVSFTNRAIPEIKVEQIVLRDYFSEFDLRIDEIRKTVRILKESIPNRKRELLSKIDCFCALTDQELSNVEGGIKDTSPQKNMASASSVIGMKDE